jgi:hypothetical protein
MMPEGLRPQDDREHQDTRVDTRPAPVAVADADQHVAGLSRRQHWLLATQDLIGKWPVGEGTSER